MGAAAIAGVAGGLVVGLIKGQFVRTVRVDLPNMAAQHGALREQRAQPRPAPAPPVPQPSADERTALAAVKHARDVAAREGPASEPAARAIAETALLLRWLDHKKQQRDRARIYAPLREDARRIALNGTAEQVLAALRAARDAQWEEWAKIESPEVVALATMDTAMKSASPHLHAAAMTLVSQAQTLAALAVQSQQAGIHAERAVMWLEAERLALAEERAYLDDVINSFAECPPSVYLSAADADAVLALLQPST